MPLNDRKHQDNANSDLSNSWKRSLARTHGTLVMSRRVRCLSDHLARLIPHGTKVLDVGAGSGEIGAALLGKRPDLSIEGIDVLVRPDTHIPVSYFDGKTIPAADGSWDVSVIVDVLHHIEDPFVLLKEVVRVTSKELVIKDHQANSRFDHATLSFMDWVGNRGHEVVLPYNFWSRARWERAFESLGAKVDVFEENLKLYPPPFTWLFDRKLHFFAKLKVH